MTTLRFLTALGISFLGVLFLLFVAAAPLGLVAPYPPLPKAVIEARHWGEIVPIGDVKVLFKKEGEETPAYYTRLADTLFEGMGRFWSIRKWSPDPEKALGDMTWEPIDSLYTRVSPWDNYLLWLYSFLPGHEHFAQYEFSLPQKAIDRGYGVCSQVSRIVYYVLRDQGINASLLSHPNHTLVAVKEGLIDANYGVFVPHSTQELKENPKLLDLYYTRLPEEIYSVRKIFSEQTGQWTMPEGSDAVYARMQRLEKGTEIAKWIPPLFLIFSGLLFLPWPARARKD